MKWGEWLDNWSMKSLKITAFFLEMEWKPNDKDKDAAWELYIELLTRITTQPLAPSHGDEKVALESIHSLFPTTRETIKRHGRGCAEFTKIAIVVLNQIVRPFTAKWHREALNNAFYDPQKCFLFRKELADLQDELRVYTRMLGEMAGLEKVEDLTDLEKKD